MRRTPGPQGPFAQWLVANRKRRGYEFQHDALAAYRKLAGLSIAPSQYAQWESGSRVPRETNPKRLALYAFYGSEPSSEPEPEPAAPGLLDLIAGHTQAIKDLVEQMKTERAQRQLLEQVLLGVLEGQPGPHTPNRTIDEGGSQSGGPSSAPRGDSQQ